MEKLILNIISYLDYIKNNCGLNVSVHFGENTPNCLPSKAISILMPYNFHSNPYCIAVKKNHHNRCICHQKKIIENSFEESFCKMCHAGVFEYIHPIYNDEKAIGFVAVSGYRKSEPNVNCENTELWKSGLSEEEIPKELCDAIIPPLRIMLEQLYSCYAKETMPANEYNMIVQFLNEYHNNITLSDLCSHFGRSKSYISHMFKKQCGMTLRTYCNNLKLRDAKKLLESTDISVTSIALDTGFNDVSYFIYLFRKKFGVSPLKYRNK